MGLLSEGWEESGGKGGRKGGRDKKREREKRSEESSDRRKEAGRDWKMAGAKKKTTVER